MSNMTDPSAAAAAAAAMQAKIDYMKANHNTLIYTVSIVFAALSTICLSLRLIAKAMRKNLYTIDDWLLVAAWCIAIAETSMIADGAYLNHFGYHAVVLIKEEIIADLKGIFAAPFMQITALTLRKFSVLILLHRIFSAIAWFKRFCWAMGIFISLYMLASLFAAAFICFPASQLWNPEVQGTCGNQVLLDRIIPVPWVLTDFGILIAPLFVIRKLQLSRSGIVRVYAAFLIGAATCIVSTIRYRTTFFKLVDFSWNMIPITIWNIIEVHVTIACPSLMLSGPVIAWFISLFPHAQKSTQTETLPSFVKPQVSSSNKSSAARSRVTGEKTRNDSTANELRAQNGLTEPDELREMPSFLTTPDERRSHSRGREHVPAQIV